MVVRARRDLNSRLSGSEPDALSMLSYGRLQVSFTTLTQVVR